MPSPDDDDAPEVAAPDDLSALFQWLADRLDPDDMETAEQLVENILTAPSMASDRRRITTDAYLGVSTMINRETIRELQAIREAEQETGIMGMDSAYEIYAAALRQRGLDTKGLAGSAAAARQIFRMSRGQAPRQVAMDSARVTARSAMFPNADRLSKRYG